MIYVGDANDPATILKDSDVFYSTYCASSPDDQVAEWIKGNFGPSWGLGAHAAALVQMYDLVAPIDRARAARYLERLRQIALELLANRDDNRDISLVDPFRGRVMPAWGGIADDRDEKWNTDVVIAGLFTYAMAAFARRVAHNPALYGERAQLYGADAIRFITAKMETYEAFRPELHLVESDPQAYFTVPAAYSDLVCNGNKTCENYRSTAGMPLSWNENFSMMKALAEVALASDSALYRGSPDVTPERLRLATEEVPLLIAKNVTFFVNNLRPNTLSDGTQYFEWNHQLPLPRIQDTAHGGLELGCLAVLLDDQIRLDALLARAGRSERVPLSPSLFERFANTFLRKVYNNDNTLNENVNGTGDRGGKWNWECAGWIPLAQFDPWVWIRGRDTNYFHTPYLREDNHAALLRYRQFNSMKYLTDFAGQNWLITPAALAVGEPPPASIHDQKWLLVLSGVVIADLKGDSSSQWDYQTVSFTPDMAGADDPSSTSGPLNWAINHFSIAKPPGSPGEQYLIRFSVEQWAPFASLSSIFNQGQSINSGFAVDAWRPNHFGSGTDVLSNRPVNNLFTGINIDLAVRDTDAWLYRLGYNITLLGKIVFVGLSRQRLTK
jgi:hypothetical protein